VQVDPIKPTSKAPGTRRLKLNYDEPLSRFAFKFNLRRCNKEVLERLDPNSRASLSRAASALRDAVSPRSIFPLGLSGAGTTGGAAGAYTRPLLSS